MQAEKAQDKAKAKKELPADISKYLRGAGLLEMRYVRMVSNLCAQTYYMHKLTVSQYFFMAASIQTYSAWVLSGTRSGVHLA